MSRKWINYVDPYLTLFKQTIPLVGVTFLHMKQSFLTLFLQEKVDHKLFKPNVFHPQLIKYWKIKMCNQFASIITNVDPILSIRFQVSCSVPKLMENDPYRRINITCWGVNGKRIPLAPLPMCFSRSTFICHFKRLSYSQVPSNTKLPRTFEIIQLIAPQSSNNHIVSLYQCQCQTNGQQN